MYDHTPTTLHTVHGSHATWKTHRTGEAVTHGPTPNTSTRQPRSSHHRKMSFHGPFYKSLFQSLREENRKGKCKEWNPRGQGSESKEAGLGFMEKQPEQVSQGFSVPWAQDGDGGELPQRRTVRRRFQEAGTEGPSVQASRGFTAHWGCGNYVQRSVLHLPALLQF